MTRTSREQSPGSVTVMDADAMNRALARICYEIIERNEGLDRLVIIGVRTGGVPLAHRIARRLTEIEGTPVPCGELDVTPHRDDLGPGEQQVPEHGSILQGDDLPESLAGMTVVLVDDVLYTGRTTRAALDAIVDHGRPDRILLAVLVDRGHRELPIRADFVGKNMPTSLDEAVDVHLSETDGEDLVTIRKVVLA